MSSEVGTMWFMAPELFDGEQGKPVTYHRNVDVFSAGLTFTAMLQAQPGRNLVPKAEGSTTGRESNNPIGFAMNQRGDSELLIVVNKTGDDTVTCELKELIRRMTCVNPEKRLSSLKVKQHLARIIRVSLDILKHI